MTCRVGERTTRTRPPRFTTTGQPGHRRPDSPCRHRQAAPAPSADTYLDFASFLVGNVAALIPAPPVALSEDCLSCAAFESLLGEAADRIVALLGDRGAEDLQALSTSALTADPVSGLLVEYVLQHLAVGSLRSGS